jgi:hypothetical protein
MTMKHLRRALVFLAACGCSDLDDDEAVCTASVAVGVGVRALEELGVGVAPGGARHLESGG